MHLAAVIPPSLYRSPALARKVNVDATKALVRAAEALLTDWMDTARAQEAPAFQHHSWPAMLAEMRARMGWKRYLLRLVAPAARVFLARRAAYRDAPGTYADLWAAIADRLGDPCLARQWSDS